MRLMDRMDILLREDGTEVRTNVPCYVGSATSGQFSITEGAHGLSFIETQVLITRPDVDLRPDTHDVRWQGTRYRMDGAVLLRTKDGKPHHQTVRIRKR